MVAVTGIDVASDVEASAVAPPAVVSRRSARSSTPVEVSDPTVGLRH
jgi:hypothetical protein